jgi:hypothetical protein
MQHLLDRNEMQLPRARTLKERKQFYSGDILGMMLNGCQTNASTLPGAYQVRFESSFKISV